MAARHRWWIDADAKAQVSRLWRRGQVGWPRAYPLVQFPNPPLLVAILGSLAGAVGLFGAVGLWRVVYVAGIVIWAALEVTRGVNLFRRLLGCAVLVWLILGLAGAR